MKRGDGDRPGNSLTVHRLDMSVEDPHGHGHVAGMRGDTGFTGTDHCQLAADTADGGATASRLALVAGLRSVIKVGAAGSLKQIAGRGRLVP